MKNVYLQILALLFICITCQTLSAQCGPGEDITLPSISCPSDILASCESNPITFTDPTVSDNCDLFTGDPVSGFTYLGTINGRYFYVSDGFFAPTDAFIDASINHGFVATIEDASEQEFLRSTLVSAGFNSQYLIGITDEETEGDFVWNSESIANYTNWGAGNPSNSGGTEHYTLLRNNGGNNGSWNDISNTQSRQYILEQRNLVQIAGQFSETNFPFGTTTNTFLALDASGNASSCSFNVTIEDTSVPTITCPADISEICENNLINYADPTFNDNCDLPADSITGYTKVGVKNGRTFYVSDASLSWQNAKNAAISESGSLGTIDSQELNDYLRTRLNELSVDRVYLGYTDELAEGTFVWQSGIASSYTNWDSSQPDNAGGNENYLEFRTNGKWNDGQGNTNLRYIIELEGGLEQTAGLPSGSTFPIGTTTNTFIVTDGSGNTASCGFNVEITDTVAPTVVCPSDISVETDSNLCTAIVDFDFPTITDNCVTTESAPLNQTNGRVNQGRDCGGTESNHLRIYNLATEGITHDYQLTGVNVGIGFADNTQSFIVNLYRGSQILDAVTTYAGSLSDTFTPLATATVVSPSSNATIVFVPFDVFIPANGEIYVEVVTPSTADFLMGYRAQASSHTTNSFLNCGGNYSIPASFAYINIAGNQLTNQITTQTTGLPSGSEFPAGVTTNTYEVSDDSGNTSSCSFNVIVTDTEVPTAICVAPFTLQLDALGAASITAGDIDNGSTDNCGIVSYTIDKTNFSCDDIGDNTITLTVTDANGNNSQCTTIVTVEDNIVPIAMCVAPFSVQLNGLGNASITADEIDNGSTDACGIASRNINITDFTCTDIGIHTVTLTITDVNGNMSMCSTEVTVEDTSPPQITALSPAPAVVVDKVPEAADYSVLYELNIGVNGSYASGAPYTQNNSGVTGVNIDRVAYYLELDETFVWVSMDDFSDNDFVQLGLPNPTSNRVILENLVSNMNIVSNSPMVTEGTGIATGNIEMFFGNYFGTANQGIGGSNGIYDFDDSPNTNGSYGSFQVHNYGAQQTLLAFNKFNQGNAFDIGIGNNTLSSHKDYTFRQNSGSYTSRKLYIMVQEILPEITVQLEANGMVDVSPSDFPLNTSDNCTSTPTNSLSQNSFDCTHIGANTIQFSSEDAAGNIKTINVIVNVEDTIAPIAECAAPFTIYLDAMGTTSITVDDIDNGSSDACGIDSMSLDVMDFTCNDVGENTVTITVTDVNGNSSSCETIVTIVDALPPTVIVQDITVELDALGMAMITPDMIDNGSIDNCEIASLELDIDTFSCDNIGENLVSLIVTDVNGNEQSASATVTIIDMIGITVISGPVDIFTGTGPSDGTCSTIVTYDATIDAFTLEDNCGDPSVTATIEQTGGLGSGASFPVGYSIEEFTITDSNGNITIYTFEVTVVDTTLPVIDCPDDLLVSTQDGLYLIDDYSYLVSDNCSTDSELVIVQDPVPGTQMEEGEQVNVTLTATDAVGNTTNCAFMITVDSSLGFNDQDFNESAITLYPNPSHDMVYLDAGNYEIEKVELYDLRGRLVRSKVMHSINSEFSVSQLESATYLVYIYSGEHMVVKRIIKD